VVRVSDANETPISDATVTVNSSPARTGKTGTNGEMSFAGLSAGVYSVTVLKPGYVTHVITADLHDGDQDTLDVHLMPVVLQGSMHVTTRDHHGALLGHVQVIITGPNNYYSDSQSSDHYGSLTLSSLVPGTYTVRCYTRPQGTATVIVAADQTSEVEISQTAPNGHH
jgi:hypothetical protein